MSWFSGQIAAISALLVSVIPCGCQFHASLGPFDQSATAFVRAAARPPTDHRTVQVPHDVHAEGESPGRADHKELQPEIESAKPAKRIQQASGWRRTSESDENASVRHASAERNSIAGVNTNTGTESDRTPIQALPMPVPPAASGEVTPIHADLASTVPEAEKFPIDLVTALRLAGGESWDVQLALEKVRLAYARLDAAKALWLPSLVAGIGYTKHDGQIQDTRGDVFDVSRNAFFVGGGAQLGDAPLAGPSGGPARFFVDLSLADAIFEPLVARQSANAEYHHHSAIYNDTLQSASLAYFELLRGQGKLASARRDLENARELVKLTEAFVLAGKGSRADIARARTEESTRRQMVVQTRLAMQVASAELARILRLDPETTLFGAEERLLPVEFLDNSVSLADHVQTGLQRRPEISEAQFRLDASSHRVRAEQMRPFMPHLTVGTSAGGFGGGVNNEFNQLNGRSDFDVLAVWRVRNLGFGTQAEIEKSETLYQTAHHSLQKLRDTITTEITQVYYAIEAQRERISLAEISVKEATESLKQNKARIRGLEGLPLEMLQSVQAVAQANAALVDVVVDFNQSQVRMLRATGRSPVADEE